MKLFKVGKIWAYRYQIAGVRTQRSTGTSVRGQAEAIAMQAFQEAKQRARGEEPITTLGKLRDAWLEVHAATVSASHWRDVCAWKPYDLEHVKADRLSTELVETARAKRLAGCSPATANLWLRILNLLGHWAVRRGMISALPWRLKMLKVQKRVRPTLPASKAQSWLAAAESNGRPANRAALGRALRLMVGLGLRVTEALGARWEWIDWERKTYTPGQTKGKEAVALEMPAWLVVYLLPAKADLGLILGVQHPIGFCRKAIKFANEQCATPGLSPHRLRGTFATMHSESGTPIQIIQKMMRHKNVSTTMAYLESDPGVAKKQQEEVARRMGFA